VRERYSHVPPPCLTSPLHCSQLGISTRPVLRSNHPEWSNNDDQTCGQRVAGRQPERFSQGVCSVDGGGPGRRRVADRCGGRQFVNGAQQGAGNRLYRSVSSTPGRGDNFDIVAAYALPQVDLRAVVLDITQGFRDAHGAHPNPTYRDPSARAIRASFRHAVELHLRRNVPAAAARFPP